MAKHPKDLTGMKYNRLKVIKRVLKPSHLKGQRVYYLCLCDCGNEKVITKSHITTGHTSSCGCKVADVNTERNKGVLAELNKTHGMSNTPFYEVWKKMKHRCYNENNKNYHNYGGRGISVCEEWDAFEGFKNDMHSDYLKFNKVNGDRTATIERLDVDGDYCKKNCTWITIQEQQLNKRNNIRRNA